MRRPALAFFVACIAIFIALSGTIFVVYAQVLAQGGGLADPIQEHFGQRPAPAPGFLVLTAMSLPAGFRERQHHYSLHEYTIDFVKTTENGNEYLSIVESDITKFLEPKEFQGVTEFTYQREPGRVYALEDRKDNSRITHSLFWFNGPKQRIYLSISAPKRSGYSSADLIRIIESMQVAAP